MPLMANIITGTRLILGSLFAASMVVVGGGVIGVEFAAMYNSFGTKVTIVEMLPQILPGIDSEIVKQVRADLELKGIKILTSARLHEVGKVGGDRWSVKRGIQTFRNP